MTEQQWLTSTNPAEMVAFLGERITDEHQRLYFEACRKERDAEYSRAKNSDWEVPAALRAEILRDIVPFRPMRIRKQCRACQGDGKLDDDYSSRRIQCRACEPWGSGFNGNVELDLSWNDQTIPLMVDAMMNKDCDKQCQAVANRTGRWVWIDGIDTPHWLGCVCKNGRIPRAEPRWADMLEIADALEEGAGCRDQHILEHLRIKRRHWKGCHVIELLSQKS